MIGAMLADGRLRIVEAVVVDGLRGLYRALDVTRGDTWVVAVARASEVALEPLRRAWRATSQATLPAMVPNGDGLAWVAELEGQGHPLSAVLGARHPLRVALRFGGDLASQLGASDARNLGRLHPALVRVTTGAHGGASPALGLASAATRVVELLARDRDGFASPPLVPSLLPPELRLASGTSGAASLGFQVMALVHWLVHGEPPYGVTPLVESQRLFMRLPELRPLVAHVDAEVDRALAGAFAAVASARPPLGDLATLGQMLRGLADHVPDPPPAARDPRWAALSDPARVLAQAELYLGDGAVQAQDLLAATIEALQAARWSGAFPEAARTDFRDAALAVLGALATPIGAHGEARFRGAAVAVPGGHGPAFRLAAPRAPNDSDPSRASMRNADVVRLWAVATVLDERSVLAALGDLDVAVLADDALRSFLAAVTRRQRGEAWRPSCAAATEGAVPRFAPSPAVWAAALAAIDPPPGAPPWPARVQAALQASLTAHAAGAGDAGAGSARAEVDWVTLALQRLAARAGVDVALAGAGLPRWPGAAPAPTAREVLGDPPDDATLVLASGWAGAGRGVVEVARARSGRVRAERRRGPYVRGFEAAGDREIARKAFEAVLAAWSELAAPVAPMEQAALAAVAGALGRGERPPPLTETVLGLRAAGRSWWWRLPDAPWARAIIEALTGSPDAGPGLRDVEPWRRAAPNPPIGFRPEARMLMNVCGFGGEPFELGRLLAAIAYTPDELARALEAVRGSATSGLEANAERACVDLLVARRAVPLVLAAPVRDPAFVIDDGRPDGAAALTAIGVSTFDVALPEGRIRWADGRGTVLAEARCAALFSWSAGDLLWASELPSFATARVPVVPCPAWLGPHVEGVEADEAADIARAAARPGADFVYRASSGPSGRGSVLYLEVRGLELVPMA